MSLDYRFFRDLLEVDSSSGREQALTELLARKLTADFPEACLERLEVGDGTQNLLLSYGEPKVVFCTHLDTVPPYIAPRFLDAAGTECGPEGVVDRIFGRGACDAKGQILSLYSACRQLYSEGRSGWALLLLSGEETGSHGAKAFARTGFEAPWLIVGEPTEGKMVGACKGTLSYDLHFSGVPFHSGYPQWGRSAVELFTDFMIELEYADFPRDKVLGETSWNVGLLHSDNPQNVLSPALDCRLYFRTTFASHAVVQKYMDGCRDRHLAGPEKGDGECRMSATFRGGDTPASYDTLPGFPQGPAAFGSDAPHLSGFAHKIICGPGSIRHAHRDDEQISAPELEAAAEQYVQMFCALAD